MYIIHCISSPSICFFSKLSLTSILMGWCNAWDPVMGLASEFSLKVRYLALVPALVHKVFYKTESKKHPWTLCIIPFWNAQTAVSHWLTSWQFEWVLRTTIQGESPELPKTDEESFKDSQWTEHVIVPLILLFKFCLLSWNLEQVSSTIVLDAPQRYSTRLPRVIEGELEASRNLSPFEILS